MSKNYFKSIKNTGFTIVEALVAVNLVGISIYFGSSAISQITKMKVNSQLYVNVNLAKRNLLSVIQNDTAWVNTINGNGAEFDCLKNITGSLVGTGCEAKNDVNGYPFIIYNDSNTVHYDPINSATAGFNNSGDVCNDFDAVNGNSGCPYRATFRWRPVCDLSVGTKCFQPMIEIFGEITIKKNAGVFNIQKSNNSFQILRPFVNCPVQTIDFLAASGNWTKTPAISSGFINATLLTTTDVATVPATSFVYQTQLFACDDVTFNFRNQIGVLGGYLDSDAANTSSVCISDPNQGNKCIYEWRQAQTSWSLWQRNLVTDTMVRVYDMPVGGTKPSFEATTTFSLQSKRGAIYFIVDTEVFYIFNAVWPRNYSIKIVPPPNAYSRGIEPF